VIGHFGYLMYKKGKKIEKEEVEGQKTGTENKDLVAWKLKE
jgi:hypothetical protein